MKRALLTRVARAGLLLTLGSAAALPTTDARAQASSAAIEQAKIEFGIGAQAYATGKFGLAVSAFERAFKLVPRPEILFSLAQAERRHCVGAKDRALLQRSLSHFREYYALPNPPRSADAVEAIGELERLLQTPDFGGAPAPAAAAQAATTLSIGTDDNASAGARVYLDGRSVGELPFEGPVSPGAHRVEVRLDGFIPASANVLVSEGTRRSLLLKLIERPVGVAFDTAPGTDIYVDGAFMGRTPLPVTGVPLSPGTHTAVLVRNGRRLVTRDVTVVRGKPMLVRAPLEVSTQRVASYVIGGAGVASLVASGVFYGIALAEQSRAQNREAQRLEGNLQPGGLDQYNAAVANRDTYRAAGTVAALGGVAALSVGALLYAFDRPDPNSVPLRRPEGPTRKPGSDFELGLAPVLAPGMAGAGAFGHF